MRSVIKKLAVLILFSFIFVQNCDWVCAVVENKTAKNTQAVPSHCCETPKENSQGHCSNSDSKNKHSHSCNCELLKEYPNIASCPQISVELPRFSISPFFLPIESADQFKFCNPTVLIIGHDPPLQQYRLIVLSSRSSRAPPFSLSL